MVELLSPDVLLITLRESLEAFLIISILAGLVVKIGLVRGRKYLLWGAGAAVAFSIVVGFMIDRTVRTFFEGSGLAELFEGVAALLAVAILTYMVVWMYRHTLSLVAEFRKKAHAAMAAGRPGLLFGIAFVAVAREGLETVLFLATQAPTTGGLAIMFSVLLALAISATLAFFVFSGIIRLNIRKFFAVSGVLLIFFAGGLLATSVHEFTEVGVVPETPVIWSTASVLSQDSFLGATAKALFGYRDSPTALEALAYFGYVIGLLAWFLRGVQISGRFTSASSSPKPEPRTE